VPPVWVPAHGLHVHCEEMPAAAAVDVQEFPSALTRRTRPPEPSSILLLQAGPLGKLCTNDSHGMHPTVQHVLHVIGMRKLPEHGSPGPLSCNPLAVPSSSALLALGQLSR